MENVVKIPIDQAIKEVDNFLCGLIKNERSRERLNDQEEKLIELVADGVVYFNEEGRLVVKLYEPISEKDELSFKKTRVSVGEIEKIMVHKNEITNNKAILSKIVSPPIHPALLDKVTDDFVNLQICLSFFLPA